MACTYSVLDSTDSRLILQPTILYCARLVVQKGPDIMLEAMPEILQQRSDAVCIFVGDGHLREELEDRARELGIEHAIRWLGSMGGEPLKSLFKACDLVCVPSRNEPFGIVVLEGWASGKVVVATNSGGPGEFVRHEDDGFHVYPEPGSVAWGVKQVFSDFDRSREVRKADKPKFLENVNTVMRLTTGESNRMQYMHGSILQHIMY